MGGDPPSRRAGAGPVGGGTVVPLRRKGRTRCAESAAISGL